jgi:predicted TIM-barrel fold metal-dependent hydrolase/RimJ/RimL family protein N-acetyltransferase
MYFDCHFHLGKKSFFKGIKAGNQNPLAVESLPDSRWETYAKLAEKKSIFKALALPYPMAELNTETVNAYVSEAFRKNRELFVPFWRISNTITEDDVKKNYIRGFKEHFALKKFETPGHFAAAYDLLQQNNLFLTIHPHMSERVEKILYLKKNFPKLKIILAHSGRKWPFTGDEVLERIIPGLKKYQDLYFDTSTIRDSAVITEMVHTLGSRRILFGSDYPYYKKKNEDIYDLELQTIQQAQIAAADRENILYKNFKHLFLKDTWVRRCSQNDREELLAIIDAIDPEERKYLALDQKMTVIRQNIKNQRHIYLIENRSQILGFLRESGRPDNGAVIEEIYIKKQTRGSGYARLLLETVDSKFRYLEAKTFKENRSVAALFEKFGFQVEKTSSKGNILYWKKTNA